MFRFNNHHQGAAIGALLRLLLLNDQLKHVVMSSVRSCGRIFIQFLFLCVCVCVCVCVWRKLHNEELNDLYSLHNTVRVVKSRRMR